MVKAHKVYIFTPPGYAPPRIDFDYDY